MKRINIRDWVSLCIILGLLVLLVYPHMRDTVGSSTILSHIAPVAPTWSLFIAAISLFIASFTTWLGWRRKKRQDTLEAWSRWSDATLETRSLISEKLGIEEITKEQATALTTHTALVPGRSPDVPLTRDEKNEILTAIAKTLNGLERLALGHQRGIYDLETFREVGGTIILRQFERLKPYVVAKRTMTNRSYRQASAYTSLESFCTKISARKATIDAARLNQLKR
ncbi:DUF4760 domain-containing protein [Glutamicibacter sp. PAEs-4]|uniref:DUF4760 domain-containing protein n=1 Tax=Glutamicibacter sp. PAEs-4 TaxID=3444114 RepID=UPI003EB89FBE